MEFNQLKKKKPQKLEPLKSMRTITDKFNENSLKNKREERDENKQISKWKINLYDYSNTIDLLKDFSFIQNSNHKQIDFKELYDSNQVDFNATKYVGNDSIGEFYSKYSKTLEYLHKDRLSKLTPSFNFIKAIRENHIIPNPVGIIKNKGKLGSIELK